MLIYKWLYQHIAGPWPVKLVVLAALVATLAAVLWYGIFPLTDPESIFGNPTL